MNTEFHFNFAEPIVCTAIHNGHDVSPEIEENLAVSEEIRLREEDPRTGYFTRISTNRIIHYTSRFEYDLNRPRDKAFYLQPADAWGLEVRKFVPRDKLIEQCLKNYDLFYRRTAHFMTEMSETFNRFFVYDIHSYNHHRLGAEEPFDDPEMNPEIILGTSNMPEKWLPLVEQIRDNLHGYPFMGRQLDVRINVKFPGGFFSRWLHNSFPQNVCCIALEFKKIFMNEWTGEFYPEVLSELRNALSSTKPVILKYLANETR